jgi:hypothetical protein
VQHPVERRRVVEAHAGGDAVLQLFERDRAPEQRNNLRLMFCGLRDRAAAAANPNTKCCR